jgi:hypothetical protein
MTRGLRLLFVVLLATGSASAQSRATALSPLQGAWRIVEVLSAGQTAPMVMSQPSLYLFTGKHYSFVAVSSQDVRPSPVNPANVTGTEALAVWGPFMAQSGTYEASGTTLTVRPLVAKNPSAMAGGQTTYSYKLEGDKLTLTVQENGAGTMAVTTRLVRVE